MPSVPIPIFAGSFREKKFFDSGTKPLTILWLYEAKHIISVAISLLVAFTGALLRVDEFLAKDYFELMSKVEQIKAEIDPLSFREKCGLNALLHTWPEDE